MKTSVNEAGPLSAESSAPQKSQVAFHGNAANTQNSSMTFVIAGRVGVGKSSIVKSLRGNLVCEHHDEPAFLVQRYLVEMEDVNFNVVDTPSLCEDTDELDSALLGRMQSAIKDFHALWFVTQIDETRVRSEEKRAIQLISQAFHEKERIWLSAMIVFTFAGRVPAGDFSAVLVKRTELIRREIALHAGAEAAAKVPSVAVENKADTTPDGKLWRGELFKTLMSISRTHEIAESSSKVVDSANGRGVSDDTSSGGRVTRVIRKLMTWLFGGKKKP